MATKVYIQGIIPKKSLGSKFEDTQNALRVYLQTTGATKLIKELNKTVVNWEEAPTFKAKVTIPYNTYIRLSVEPSGRGKINWIRLNYGTGPRSIVSRKGLMHFQTGYSPKTKPGGKWGGTGRRFGKWIRNRRVVRKHRIEPRQFTEIVLRNKEKELKSGIDNIIRKNL